MSRFIFLLLLPSCEVESECGIMDQQVATALDIARLQKKSGAASGVPELYQTALLGKLGGFINSIGTRNQVLIDAKLADDSIAQPLNLTLITGNLAADDAVNFNVAWGCGGVGIQSLNNNNNAIPSNQSQLQLALSRVLTLHASWVRVTASSPAGSNYGAFISLGQRQAPFVTNISGSTPAPAATLDDVIPHFATAVKMVSLDPITIQFFTTGAGTALGPVIPVAGVTDWIPVPNEAAVLRITGAGAGTVGMMEYWALDL